MKLAYTKKYKTSFTLNLPDNEFQEEEKVGGLGGGPDMIQMAHGRRSDRIIDDRMDMQNMQSIKR